MTSYRAVLWIPSNDPRRPPAERKRQRSRQTPLGRVVQGHRTDEPTQADWKQRLYLEWKQQYPEPMHGPLSLTVCFVRPSPASTNKKPTEKRPWPWAWMTKPDTSNMLKVLEDGLTGAAWVDDAQVVREEVVKHQAPDAVPGVWIVVEECFEPTVLLVLELCREAAGDRQAARLPLPGDGNGRGKGKRELPQAVLDAMEREPVR